MPIESCSSLQASESAPVERLVFASHSSRNENELNPEFLCYAFHSLFTMRTEQIPEHRNGSALDSGTESVKIVAGDPRRRDADAEPISVPRSRGVEHEVAESALLSGRSELQLELIGDPHDGVPEMGDGGMADSLMKARNE
jgi:hypothetical protein